MRAMKRVLVLSLCLPLLALGSVNERRNKQVMEFFVKLEQKLAGERDLKKATKLLKRVQGVDRSWLVLALAQYQRTMVKEPIEGLKLLAPEVLPASKAKSWLTELKTAENARKAKWVQAKADAYRNKQPDPPAPIGLAVDFPKVAEFDVQESSAQVALEVGRCLMDLGKIDAALKVIDDYGKNFEGDGRVLAFECLGDLYLKMRLFEKSVDAYRTGSKLLIANKPTEGLSKWQEIMRRRLVSKLINARELWDADRYGPGFVMYRAAETRRRKDKDYLEAIWLYDQIIKTFPKTVYSEAAKAYRLKSLLQLATKKYPGKAERTTLNEAEKRLQKEKDFYKVAKRCKVPQASLDEIKATIAKREAKLGALKAIPYGKKALDAAKTIAKGALEENEWGLYRGGMHLDLAYAVLLRNDVSGSKERLERLVMWCEKAPGFDKALANYATPTKAKEISQPPKYFKKRDEWGNVIWTSPKIGALVNRRTAPWLVHRLASEGHELLGFCKMLLGDTEGAAREAEFILRFDEYEKALHASEVPTTYSRLKKAFSRGYLISSAETLKGVPQQTQLLLRLGDFAFEREQWKTADGFYGRVYRTSLDSLPPRAASYLINVYGKVLLALDRDKEALRVFKQIDSNKSFRKTPSWSYVKFTMAQIGSRISMGSGLKAYDSIIAQTQDEEDRILARFLKGQLAFTHGRYKLATKYFNHFLANHRNDRADLAKSANQFLNLISRAEQGEDIYKGDSK